MNLEMFFFTFVTKIAFEKVYNIMFNEAHKAQYLLDSHDSHITEQQMTHGLTCMHA